MIHTLRSWLRKVDDTFVISKFDKIEILDELNKFNCKVQFTYESATDNNLPFLDCLIEIINQSISKENTHRTIHALHIKPTGTCKSRYYKNTGKKGNNCL